MKVGYIRVSTKEQNLDRQINAMDIEKVDKVFCDKLSGKDTNRTEFKKMMKFLRQGDELVVASLDRIGRNYTDIKEIIAHIHKEKIILKVLDAPFLNFHTGNKTLDKAMGDMFISLLGYISQNEREKMLERQKQGIIQAKKRGVYKGRPIKYNESSKNPQNRLIFKNICIELRKDTPIRQIARENGVSKSTVYSIKQRMEEKETNG